ncbi:methylmalonyl-CoA epimerase [Dictyostelium purpureum]|uniref:Methylmalonyl-CoA epimerase, mitochondrial n=1 Tax=Dictyostelium purpureum TaxID=5786 RepID=F0ZE17_DICPU|nr:methylmalonyl-CoA epimerase [Dictyostelium purpureum]EGC37834.1 methylmalonyl-CoA epimerase [Dictyostelium purpureum]|eukprot:XP_003285679.1 methylmalonyl-CoA epimerase [Dictyostelium purpureum]
MIRYTSKLFNSNSIRSFTTNNNSKIGQIIGSIGVGKLNHVAIAVPNLKESMDLYRNVLGADVSEPADQIEHGVTTVFVGLENTKIELLYPLGDKSPIEKFLQKNPAGGIHHICLEVDDIYKAVDTLLKENVKIIDPKPKIGAHGKPVVFLHPKSMNGVLVELEQK